MVTGVLVLLLVLAGMVLGADLWGLFHDIQLLGKLI